MISYLSFAAILGLSSGFAPGPLLTLVIAETLQHGRAAGFKVSIAPLITDTPIVIVVVLLLSQISHVDPLIGGIAILGGGFVFYLGVISIRIRPVTLSTEMVKERSLLKGIVTNFFNPAPYIFWIGVGAPMLIKAYDESPVFAVAFIVTFYGLMVASKLFLSVVTAKSRNFLSGDIYLNIMRLLGVAMCLLALGLVYDGLRLSGLIG
ncbi:MAG: LysE family transporter [Gammaproteobacteria bacterium]|nr:LysE family transporter [Gammaproteobacteria bacterium]